MKSLSCGITEENFQRPIRLRKAAACRRPASNIECRSFADGAQIQARDEVDEVLFGNLNAAAHDLAGTGIAAFGGASNHGGKPKRAKQAGRSCN